MFYLAYRRTVFRIVATLGATAAVAACGYKGPLYHPPASVTPAPVKTPPPPQNSSNSVPSVPGLL